MINEDGSMRSLIWVQQNNQQQQSLVVGTNKYYKWFDHCNDEAVTHEYND